MKRTLKESAQFRRVFREGCVFRGRSFRAYYTGNTLGCFRLGFSLSARSGGAVQRNLMRRRLRQLASKAVIGADVVVKPAGKLSEVRWADVRDDFAELLERIRTELYG